MKEISEHVTETINGLSLKEAWTLRRRAIGVWMLYSLLVFGYVFSLDSSEMTDLHTKIIEGLFTMDIFIMVTWFIGDSLENSVTRRAKKAKAQKEDEEKEGNEETINDMDIRDGWSMRRKVLYLILFVTALFCGYGVTLDSATIGQQIVTEGFLMTSTFLFLTWIAGSTFEDNLPNLNFRRPF